MSLLRRLLLLPIIFSSANRRNIDNRQCDSREFFRITGQEHDYLIYGLTQDCQVFFMRPSQIKLLASLDVNQYNAYCYSNLIQLHITSSKSLLLVIRQAGNRICTMEISIPPMEMLFGDHLFSYSIVQSLPYAACSISPNHLALEPDLSFMDSLYKNVIYFTEPTSSGQQWNIRQFVLTPEGYLRFLDNIVVEEDVAKSLSGKSTANEYVFALDAQKNYLFQRNRFERSFTYQCAFDLMFRPHSVALHQVNITSYNSQIWLESMTVDDKLLVYTESDRSVQPHTTKLWATNLTSNVERASCLLKTNFGYEIGLLSVKEMKKMEQTPLPPFDRRKPFTKAPVPLTTKSLRLQKGSKSRTTPMPLVLPTSTSTPSEDQNDIMEAATTEADDVTVSSRELTTDVVDSGEDETENGNGGVGHMRSQEEQPPLEKELLLNDTSSERGNDTDVSSSRLNCAITLPLTFLIFRSIVSLCL